MPLLKPSTPPKKSTKPAAKPCLLKKEKHRMANLRQRGKQHQPPPPPCAFILGSTFRRTQTRCSGHWSCLCWHSSLFWGWSPPIAPIRSAVLSSFISQIFGWGVYILPLGLLVFGLWLVFRKIERIPPLSARTRYRQCHSLSLAAHRFTFICRHSRNR